MIRSKSKVPLKAATAALAAAALISLVSNKIVADGVRRVWRWSDSLGALRGGSPSLSSSMRGVSGARWTSYAAYSAFLPVFSASASAGSRRDAAGVESESYSAGITGTLSLFEGFADARAVALRKTDLGIAEIRYIRAESDAVYKLRAAFVELLWAQEQLLLAAEILDRRLKNSELVRLKYEAGREDKGSYLRVDADRRQSELELRRAERQAAVAAAAFLAQLGISGREAPKPSAEGDFTLGEIPSGEPDFTALAAETPEYLESKKRLESARLNLGVSHSRFWPQVSASASAGLGGSAYPPDEESRSASVNLSWRFFSGGADLFNAMAARQTFLSRRDDLKAAELDAALSVESSWRDYSDAFENVEVRMKYLDASMAQSEIVSARYLNGLATYQEWYQVENDFINSKKSYLNAKRDAGLKEAGWQKALGLGFKGLQ